jgi:hypothetical protein
MMAFLEPDTSAAERFDRGAAGGSRGMAATGEIIDPAAISINTGANWCM